MISVVVPIYNIKRYLPQCLESLCAQDCQAVEFILVDDGSTDGCADICDEYAAKDNRFYVIHQANAGLISARKAGAKAAKGEYIGFVDGDDYVEPSMYAEFEKAIEQYHPDMIMCEFFYSYPDREEKSNQNPSQPYYDRKGLESLYPTMLFAGPYYRFGINPCCWSKVFKKDLLLKNLLPVPAEIKMGEDAAFTYPCLLDCQSLCYIPKALYHYRIAQGSMTQSYDPDLAKVIFNAYQVMVQKSKSCNIDLSDQLGYYLLYMLNFAIRNEANPKNTRSLRQKLEVFNTLISFWKKESPKINPQWLPMHTKLLYFLLQIGHPFGLFIYTKLLRPFL